MDRGLMIIIYSTKIISPNEDDYGKELALSNSSRLKIHLLDCSKYLSAMFSAYRLAVLIKKGRSCRFN
ncbi:hypothetical protein ACTXT7_003758 [Hymenolepis weldensis]